MTEILNVTIKVPVLGKKYELAIPTQMIFEHIQELFLKMIGENFTLISYDLKSAKLIDMNTKKVIPSHITCEEASFKNGSELMLIWIEE